MPGKCRFNYAWLHMDKYMSWVTPDNDPGRAKCRLCGGKTFDVSNMGEAALASHAKGSKHRSASASQAKAIPITGFLATATPPATRISTSLSSATKQASITDAVTRNEVLTAEVMWALKVADSHYSFKSSEDASLLFQRMFPDSKIATQFACGERKCAYLCSFGLAPYFKSLTLSKVRKQRAYVMLFDESLNHHLQSKQMDLHVRLWDGANVETKYIGSEFMGHSSALDVVGKMTNLLSEIGVTNLIQISMDGPNVNWKVFEILQKSVQKDVRKSLVNIGSCGLHILHNAFRAGCKSTGWEVEHALSSIYWLFHDCPARHEDFVTATGCSTNMLRFCNHRWIENVNVSERGMLLWPHVKAYVEMVGKGKLPNPKVKSFEALKDRCADPLFTVKVQIFNSVAREVTPFLTAYQTDKPMLPFLSEDMFKLMKGIMGRFLKENSLREATSTLKLLHVAFQDSSLHKDASKIDIGFAAETTLNQLKCSKVISERQVLEIKMECQKFLITMTEKLLKKGPVHHLLVRSMQCLDPRRMAMSKELCVPQMRRMLHTLVEAKHVDESVCDDILREFSEFCDSAALQANFREFDPKTDRVDTLLYETMGSKPSFSKVWDVVKVLLVLSHGQASVERGFSINKEMIVENQKEKSLVALRLIVDHVRSVGGINKLEITKELLISAASARQKYHGYLDEEKKNKERQGFALKRKALTDELDDFKKKRARIEADISALEKSADQYAEKAEATSQLTFITKSNSFRRTAKEKKVSLLEIEKQIDAKLAEMKQ